MTASTASADVTGKSLLASMRDFAPNSAAMTDPIPQDPQQDAADPIADLSGTLLVAMPALTAPPFAHSVIYLCAHSPEDGAMGLVINRRLSQPDFAALIDRKSVV